MTLPMLALGDPGRFLLSERSDVVRARRTVLALVVQLSQPRPRAMRRVRAAQSVSEALLLALGGRPDDEAIAALDRALVLIADHELNASTFTARVIVSTLSDLHSAITGAIGALKGPLHGGANERVVDVLRGVGKKEDAEKWVRDALARKEKIMGFGHRVYKDGDPRAVYLKSLCAELAAETGNEDLEAIADVIERVWFLLSPADFFDQVNAAIWAAVLRLRAEHRVELVAVSAAVAHIPGAWERVDEFVCHHVTADAEFPVLLACASAIRRAAMQRAGARRARRAA